MERLYAYLFSIAVLGAVAWPATRSPDQDGFPLSTYPMFGREKARVGEVASAVAVNASGQEQIVPTEYIANAEAMQAVATLRRSLQAGPRSALELCEAIAARVRDARDPALEGSERILLVTEVVDAIDYLAGRATPSERRIHASCATARTTRGDAP